MNEYFDVFFHQRAIPVTKGTVLYQRDSSVEILDRCEALYEQIVFDPLETQQKEVISELILAVPIKKYLEVQFFNTQLNWNSLLKKLKELFPQFIWTKIVEESDTGESTYFCELIPVAIEKDSHTINFSFSESLSQMGYEKTASVSHILEENLIATFNKEMELKEKDPSLIEAEDVSIRFPVAVTIEENKTTLSEKRPVTTTKKNMDMPADLSEEINVIPADRSSESEILFLKESLKREKASKERVKIAKEKLEYELLAIENSMLVSGIKRFKKYQLSSINRNDWYKMIQIDLIQYDDLFRKAKFVGQSWRLNRQLVMITERMAITKNQWVYQRSRVEKIKSSVSEMDLQSMMEQCHLINERVKIQAGFLFIKPRAKLYQIDYEQLEKIGAFFDIIQTENRLLESIIEKKELAKLE